MSVQRASVPRAGFTLAEALVALFVVAVGIAGAVGLQARALRSAREAEHLSAGVQLAASLAERMRVNRAAMALPDEDNPYLQFDYAAASGPQPAAPSCYGAADCSPAQLAAFDLAETAQAVATQLPHGHMRVCRDATASSSASALPGWACDGQAEAPVAIKLGWHDNNEPDAPRIQALAGAGAP